MMRSVFYIVLLLLSVCAHAATSVVAGKSYVLRDDFQKVLNARNADTSIDSKRQVFGLSDEYRIFHNEQELAVYNYCQNPAIIKDDYILSTTTNNHWIQLVLNRGESITLWLELDGKTLTENSAQITALDAKRNVVNGKLQLTINGGKKQRGMIIFNENEQEPLFVFVDEPINENSNSDKQVLTFDGYHRGNFRLPDSVNHVVIPLGSYFVGNISAKHDFSVSGHGIISQEGVKHRSYERGEDNPLKCNIAQYNDTSGVQIQGITSIEPSLYHFWTWPGTNCSYMDVKTFGFQYESDAFIGDRIIDCFTKVNDDHVKLYTSNIQVENLTVYCQGNGNVFQFGWGNYGSRSNITVKNTTLLRDLNHDNRLYARSFINWRKPDYNNSISKVTFDGIKAHAPIIWFIKMDTENGKWHNSPSLQDFKIRNVCLPSAPACKIHVDHPQLIIDIENIKIGAKKINTQALFINKHNNININQHE